MSDQLKTTIRQLVLTIIDESASESNIARFTEIHRGKVHFVPLRYRVLGGILQALNIKFGNFIERLMITIYEMDSGVEIMEVLR